ncbi:hypothetical protein [Yokenella regensburgei]|uniref:hypothetical protein n=1 Tax=Yokenella regensburgei TaxID=158877 RepID=UPI0014333354|nr:hypothetical protein [Yokenella regensburgei]QIU89340.1 hypothetical protein HEC60_08420 [Yokenella regensburgei]
MTIDDLPKCPECGMAPEFHWRDYTFGSCSGALRCPYNHHRVSVSYHAGQKHKARIALECAWVKKVRQEVAGGTTKNA